MRERERERERGRAAIVAAILTVVCAAAGVAATVRVSRHSAPSPAPAPLQYQEKNPYDGKYTFVRLRYGGGGGMGGFRGRGYNPGWFHDYPDAEHNLRTILDAITAIEPGVDPGKIIDIDDPDLLKYPIAYMSEPGDWPLTDKEAVNLHNYLLKGGFLIVDDFPGGGGGRGRFGGGDAWPNFATNMQKVLPDIVPRQLDATNPIFHTFFEISTLDNLIPSYRGYPMFIGYFEDNDPKKRLMVIANYQNDIGESWEHAWQETGLDMVDETNQDFRFGVNYIIYAYTH